MIIYSSFSPPDKNIIMTLKNMNTILSKLRYEKNIELLIYFMLALTVVLQVIYLFISPNIGDEAFYLHEIAKVFEVGLYQAMTEGFSYLFILLTILINSIIDNEYISMRIIGIVSSIGIFFICKVLFQQLKIDVRYDHIFLLTIAFFLTRRHSFIQGIPDRLMQLVILLGFYYFFRWYYQREKLKYIIFSGIFLGISLWLRSFSFIFLLGFSLLFIVLLTFQKRELSLPFLKQGILWGAIIITIALIPQIPSLSENGTFAFENKSKSSIEHSWAHRNWFTHIAQKKSNSFFCYKRVTWEELGRHVDSYGGNAKIPVSIVEKFKADRKFFVDNILSNFFRLLFLSVYCCGFLGILFLDFIRKPEQLLYKVNNYRKDYLIGCLMLIMITGLVLSTIIIGYIEWRWYTLPLLLSILLGIYKLQNIQNNQLKTKLIIGQYIFIILMCCINIRNLLNSVIDML